jgi:hypothetical protein
MIEYLDRPPSGWFGLDVMRWEGRKWDWCALMVDVHPDDLKNCTVDFPALFYVHPKKYCPGTAQHANAGFVSLASIETGKPPGRLLRT